MDVELGLSGSDQSLPLNGTITREFGCCGVAIFHLMDQNPEKRVYRERERETDTAKETGRKPGNHETQR